MISIIHTGLAAKPEERARRLAWEEMGHLMTHFERDHTCGSRVIPIHRIVAFAIFSTRRQAEITRITWRDYEPEAKRVMVRWMKNPGDKGGLDT